MVSLACGLLASSGKKAVLFIYEKNSINGNNKSNTEIPQEEHHRLFLSK
jgi:hypothetical protein